ncbi:MAG TPA: uracil-DNA glycosylase [Acetobacteraceae bacterium]|nr:uracil-DNA glycosylase [Acetobacteraceae bacterium]
MDALAALCLQIEWGADEALDEAPVNRLRPPKPSASPLVAVAARSERAPPQPAVSPSAAPRIGAAAIERARSAAAAVDTLPALRNAIIGFDGCALRDIATQPVLAEGNPGALLLIGEAPGADDDRAGRPFAGPPGVYLDKMLASIGLDRDAALITPLIPWRPPGDRPPSPGELAICLPFLMRLIEISRPRLALLLGPLASRSIIGAAVSRRVRRGVWVDVPISHGTPLRALPTHSVAWLLSQPELRRDAWADLRTLRRAFDTSLAPK